MTAFYLYLIRIIFLRDNLCLEKSIGLFKSNEEVAMMNGNGSGWMNGGGFVFMGLFLLVLVGLGVWLVSRNKRQ